MVRHAPEFGIQARLTGVDWPAIRDRAVAKTGTILRRGAPRPGRAGRDDGDRGPGPLHGPARAGGRRRHPDHRRPDRAGHRRPAGDPCVHRRVRGCATTPRRRSCAWTQLPASMVVVGGGYIAAELAHLFSSLGVSIRLINQAGTLLETFDPEVSGRFTEAGPQALGRPPVGRGYRRAPARRPDRGGGRPAARRSPASCCWWRPAASPTPRTWIWTGLASGCARTGGSKSMSTAGPRPRGSGRWATRAPRTRLSMWPTPRPAP